MRKQGNWASRKKPVRELVPRRGGTTAEAEWEHKFIAPCKASSRTTSCPALYYLTK